MNKEIIEKELIDTKIPTIIFGAGIVGEVLSQACKDKGIKVDCFCDNNSNKTKSLKQGIKVIHTSELNKKYKDANFLISAADIRDVIEQLNGLGFSKLYAGSPMLKEFDVDKHKFKFNAPINFVEYAIDTCILCHNGYLNPEKLFLRSVDMVITERCSLKCQNCSNLMQYYEKPSDFSYKEIEKSIDSFCNIIDEVNEFRVIGGEPFMNKDFDLTIRKLKDEEKVKKIVIYTNGTIVPKDDKIESLKNDKTLIIITDYGKLSRNLENLASKLFDNNVSFYIQKIPGWTNCGEIKRHYRNIEQQEKIFRECCAKNTFTLLDGKFYRCPFSANTHRLKAVPDFEKDYINILKENIKTEEIKKRMREFILKKDYLETCDYCNGRTFGDPEIQPAIQTKIPLEYKKYDYET